MIAKVIEDKKWEYKAVENFNDLNAYGMEGWELVCQVSEYSYSKGENVYHFVMKRSYIEKDI